jgi:hypothetical protein
MPVHLAVLNACVIKVETHACPEALQQPLVLGQHNRHLEDHLCGWCGVAAAATGNVGGKNRRMQQQQRHGQEPRVEAGCWHFKMAAAGSVMRSDTHVVTCIRLKIQQGIPGPAAALRKLSIPCLEQL